MATCVPLVDVNVSTASTTWPLLLKAIGSADFISVDLELSGLGHASARWCVFTWHRVVDMEVLL